jgi:sugar lactone lactonase YvrE
VAAIAPDGTVRRIAAVGRQAPLHPNGIALMPGGAFLIAHLGPTDGGVFLLHPDGRTEDYLTALNGHALPPTNFVHRDWEGRIWVCVSTRLHPRWLAYRPDANDGYIILIDGAGARIVADGLGYTNEIVVDSDAGHLFVNETFARRTLRFDLGKNSRLENRKVVAAFGAGTFPDGLSLDSEGGLWVTSVVSNRLIRIHSDGRQTVELEDSDAPYLARVESAFQEHRMELADITSMPPSRLGNLSSLVFAGPDLRTGFLGSLGNDSLGRLAMPVAGRPPSHWETDLGPLRASFAG